ncbi:MAG: 7,8-didemethyl-8-hydroxy-5-deazariboflavin synthase subunit CofG [Nitrosopumilaceae archaeon]|nr:7,8-didemethyl-8-hydroxy-5-deazariboflavin synthase subunit CofG [Nitrosopumilaceae archaeon]
MSKLVLKSEILNQVLDGKEISKESLMDNYSNIKENSSELLLVSEKLRKRYKSEHVTFSKKVFLNTINLCKDTCSYCTYKSEPNENKLSMMSIKQTKDILDIAKQHHCVEALFVTGEQPEKKYPEAKQWLKENGFSTTNEYLIHASEIALDKGLFPHTNSGNLSYDEMKELKKTNVSIGLMLENVSERLTQKGMPHYLAASKKPKNRLQVLENSGKLKIPITTGILVGIGETENEIIESLFAIKELNEKYGNIQEVIIQNFHPKPDTMMKDQPSAEENYFKFIVALTRIIMPGMNIQIPPNLSPTSYREFLKVGINDWGGISPLTPDFVNPEFTWPEINEVQKNSKKAGYELKCRFPVYPEFFSFLSKEIRGKMKEIEDDMGLVRDTYWK